MLPCKMLSSYRFRMFGTALLILMLLLSVLSSYHYYENRNQVLERVDHQLYAGAMAARYAVGDIAHDSNYQEQTTAPVNYRRDVMTLTNLCRDLDLEFLYALVERQGKMYFSLSSLSADDLQTGDYYHYFNHYYSVVPDDFLASIRKNPDKAYYFEATDRLGSLRAVLLPCTTASGKRYFSGAAINVAVIDAALADTFRRAMVQCIILLLLAFPLAALFIWPLKCQLYTDELTGLPNRAKLKKDLVRCRLPQLMIIDIDAFKDINNYYGVHVGDQLLIKLAEALRVLIPAETRLYRLDGDEYALLCESSPRCLSVDYLVSLINELRIDIEDTEFRVSVTVGVAQGVEQVMEHADLALKEAKRVLKPYKFYSSYLHTVQTSRANLLWTYKLKEAIEGQRLAAYYQPIYDNNKGEISHYEALIRIIEEDGTVAGPAFFMDAARKSRVYSQLTSFMIDSAISFIQANDRCCTVNLLTEDIVVEESRQRIIDQIRKAPVRDRLIFEIVEAEGIDNYDDIKSFIDQVRVYGVRIAIDDFGTGYSNFDHISNLNVDYIKIDGGLIAQLNESVRSKTIVEAIIHFAKELDIKIIAEYVADEGLQQQVASMGIDYSQGYFWGKPQAWTKSDTI